MKLPRTTKLFRGHLDAAPVLCVLFPLAFFAVLQHWLILPPGTELELPDDSGSISQAAREPSYIVGVDASERLFFENQLVEPASLASRLRELVAQPGTPRTLWIYADKSVSHDRLAEIGQLARDAGIGRIVLGSAPTRTAQ